MIQEPRPVIAPTVDILLATYNGARFLPDQLQSIERQTEITWRVIARDDCSRDDSSRILADFKQRNEPGKVVVVENDRNLGAAASFSLLAQKSTAPYIMFCDQDDVWDAEKISLTLAAMRVAENDFGTDVPLLVHTDLRVVDETLATVGDSFWKFQNLDPRRDALNRLLVSNVVTGCAMMANRKLVTSALPVPDAAMMHDWWFALVAAVSGKIICLPKPTISYRQHSGNTVGAQRWGIRFVLQRLNRLRKRGRTRELMQRLYRQGEALRERCGQDCPDHARETIAQFCALPSLSTARRKMRMLRHGFLTHGVIRNIGLLLSV